MLSYKDGVILLPLSLGVIHMATLTHRLVYVAGEEVIDTAIFRAFLSLFDSGDATAASIKTYFGLDSGQQANLDDLLATKPGILASLLTRSQWVDRVISIIYLAQGGLNGYETEGDVDTALGI